MFICEKRRMEYMTVISFFILLVIQTVFAACPEPDDISNSNKVKTGLATSDTVTYTCRHGYVISNETATRTCMGDGTWNGTLPTCTDIDTLFSFECNKTGTITAVNPDPTSLIWFEASNEGGLCTAEFSEGNASVIINDCAIDKMISLVFSPYSTGIPTLIMNNVKYYNITCKSIPSDGIPVMVVDNTWIRNLVLTSREPQRNPEVIINSDVSGARSSYNNEAVQNETTVGINEHIVWKLFVPEPYIVQPLNCTAYSGEIDDAGSKLHYDIIENGCTLDASLVSHFRFENESSSKSEVIADLYAFRFTSSNKVEIVCSVKGCPTESSACVYTCDDERRRRSVPYISSANDFTDAVSAKQESVNGRYARDIDTSDIRTARLNLIVIGPPNVGLEYFDFVTGSAPRVACWTITLAAIFVALCILVHV